jgi:8-oxo-dGTP pyrophosphatase MutT (NUDIX family)
VCLFLLKKEGDVTYVLLQQRKNKKYTNGWWETGASGHVDKGENPLQAVVHESEEELGIVIDPKDIKFMNVACNKSAWDPESGAYYNFYFTCDKWTGEPKIGEPDKSYQIKWFDVKKLPEQMIQGRKEALENYLKNISYFNINW